MKEQNKSSEIINIVTYALKMGVTRVFISGHNTSQLN